MIKLLMFILLVKCKLISAKSKLIVFFLSLFSNKVNEEFKNKLEKICSQVKFIVYDPPSLSELNEHWLVDMVN